MKNFKFDVLPSCTKLIQVALSRYLDTVDLTQFEDRVTVLHLKRFFSNSTSD